MEERYDLEALRIERLAGREKRCGGAVKLGDQVVITSDGFRVLCPFPFSAALLA